MVNLNLREKNVTFGIIEAKKANIPCKEHCTNIEQNVYVANVKNCKLMGRCLRYWQKKYWQKKNSGTLMYVTIQKFIRNYV
jgi:hypothetical protein